MKPRYRIRKWVKTLNGGVIDLPWPAHPMMLKISRYGVYYFELVTETHISWGILERAI